MMAVTSLPLELEPPGLSIVSSQSLQLAKKSVASSEQQAARTTLPMVAVRFLPTGERRPWMLSIAPCAQEKPLSGGSDAKG